MCHHTSASAQLITALNPTAASVSNSIPGVDGYYLFDAQNIGSASDVDGLVPYVSLTQENMLYPTNFSPPLTAGGISYNTGVTFNNAGPATANPGTGTGIPGTGTPVEFATFSLGAGTPAAFQFGVLSDYRDVTYYTINLYTGNPNAMGAALTPVATALLDPAQTKNDAAGTGFNSFNEFYYADIAGAAAGDYLVVDGTSSDTGGTPQVTLGGVTFGPLVPEPSTYALTFAGLVLLVMMARPRRRNA